MDWIVLAIVVGIIVTICFTAFVFLGLSKANGKGTGDTAGIKQSSGQESANNTVTEKTTQSAPAEACISLCEEKLKQGIDLSAGPCLSNSIAPDWICDVAHNPRQGFDDLEENQCPSYPNTTHHFVEVGPTCNFIKEI